MLYLPSALSKIATLFCEQLLSTLVANVARVALSLSLKRTLVGGRRFRSNVAAVWNSCVFVYSNHRNPRSKSGICCRVRTSFLRVGAEVLACTFPRLFVVVDYNQFTQQGSRAQIFENSRDFVQTRGFTFGDNVTHFCGSFQCCRMLRTVEHLFLLVSSIFLCMDHGGYFDFVTCAH